MKVVLDLTRLLHEGEITREEHDRLSRLAGRDTGTLGFNILVGLGVVAVGGAALALVPTPATGVVLGAFLMAFGLFLLMRYPPWLVLANICILVAALMFGGGVLVLADGSLAGFLLVAAIFLAAAVAARSALLVVLSILAVVGAIGGGTGYSHASYELDVTRPLLTILLCTAIALGAYWASGRMRPEWERLSLVAARATLFFANFGFWVGSLWGDPLEGLTATQADEHQAFLPPMLFIIAWAVALVGASLWAIRANRRWVLNLAAVFGAIHFYTQWFENLSATPMSVLVAGLVTLAAAVLLWKWNSRTGPPGARQTPAATSRSG